MQTSRRRFLGLAAAAAGQSLLAGPAAAVGRTTRRGPAAAVIDRISILRVPGSFYRPIAMNAYDRAPKGQAGSIDLVSVALADGTAGLGVAGYRRRDDAVLGRLRAMLGTDPTAIYTWDGDRITGVAAEHRDFVTDPRLAWFEAPLLDAIGKLRGKPVHALFGEPVRDAVDAYDGTLYFADVATGRDASVIGELAARIRGDGYRAIKMKVGRPLKWLEGEAGVQRDIEAFIAAREAVGANFNLMADANNGYRGRFDQALRFLEAVDPYDPYWMEEIFPEDEDAYRRLRRAMYERGIVTRLAEGEDAFWSPRAAVRDVDGFRPWLEAGLFDVIQPDMRSVGFSNVLRQADLAARFGATLVPHNWQSELGRVMGVHAAMVRTNIPFVEDDRWHNHALDTSDHLFRDGRWVPPATPGWGVRLGEHYERFARAGEPLTIGR